MSYDYNGYVSAIAGLLVVPATDADLVAMLPNFIDAAELGLYRDLDLLDTVVRDTSATLTPTSRDFTLPNTFGRFVKVLGFNVMSPGTIVARNQLVPVSRDYLDVAWPQEAATESDTMPTMFAMITSQQVIVAPAPGASFHTEVIGTVRPTPLSAVNTTTILTLYLPDLFLVASMVFGAAYLKNFGAAADDPRSATTWSTRYKELLQSVQIEEFSKRFAASAWSSILPSPIAQPPRN